MTGLDIAINILEHAAVLTGRLMQEWTGKATDTADLRRRVRVAINALNRDLDSLDAAEQAELDAAVPRHGD